MARKLKLRPKKTLCKRATFMFKECDLYGKNIVLTYEGSNKFKSILGGLASLIIYGLILSYFILQLRVMLLRNNTSNSKNSLQKELNSDTEVHNIGMNNINFGMEIDFNGVNLLNDKSYFTYSINQVSQIYTQSGSNFVINRTKSTIPTDYWNITSFYNLKKESYDTLSIHEYLCPTTNNYTIAANYYAPRFDYIEIKVYRWNPAFSKVTWKTNITDVMKQTQLAFMISNNNIDFNNYTEAVQSYLDDAYFWYIAPGLRKKVDIYVQKNSINFVDDFVQLGQSNNQDFYQVSGMRESVLIEDTDLQFLSIYFRFDSNYADFSRRVYSFGDLLGQTGGLYSAIFMVGAVIVGIFSERLFVSSILRKIYQIDEARDTEIRKYISENKGKTKNYKVEPEFADSK